MQRLLNHVCAAACVRVHLIQRVAALMPARGHNPFSIKNPYLLNLSESIFITGLYECTSLFLRPFNLDFELLTWSTCKTFSCWGSFSGIKVNRRDE